MGRPFLRSDDELVRIFETYGGTVYRVCFSFLRVPADAEDAVQETFLRLIRSGPEYESEAHLKAWLIRVASNVCRNMLKSAWRKHEDLEAYPELAADAGEGNEVLSEILKLPEKYRILILLYYYEGYDGAEIAKILGKSPSAVRSGLQRARRILRERLGEGDEG